MGIVLHHEGGGDVPLKNRKAFPDDLRFEEDKGFQVARMIQEFHTKVRGWKDTGYHFIVTRGGLVLEGRHGSYHYATKGEVIYAAHCGVTTYNAAWFGVCCEGDYREDSPTPAQWRALVELCANLSIWGGTQSQNIVGHRDVKATICPGDRLYRKLEDLRREVRTKKLAIQGLN